MPLFVLHCIDRAGRLEARKAAREAHLAHIQASGADKLAGPMLDEAGEMAGSLIIIEADDLASAKAFSAGDPYLKAGVFERVDIRPFRLAIGAL